MLVTQKDAKKILGSIYPEVQLRFTTGCTVIVPPIIDFRPKLAYRKLAPGPNSAVRIGLFLHTGEIDWSWSYEVLEKKEF